MKKIISIIVFTILLLNMCPGALAKSFLDVGDEFSWATKSIEKFYKNNIIVGVGEGRFAPERSVTRAEFAKMLALTFDIEKKDEIAYKDVDKNSWKYEYICMVDAYTVLPNTLDNSYSKDVYLPDKNASRQEIVAAIASVIGIEKINMNDYLEENFKDASSVSRKIYALVNCAAKEGLILGYEDSTLRPKDDVTRAEAVVLLDRALEYKKANDEIKTPAPTNSPKPVKDITSVVSVSQMLDKNEKCYALYYAFGGVYQENPLIVKESVAVGGLKTKIEDIECGDVIVYGVDINKKVESIRVVYSPSDTAPSSSLALNEIIAPSSNMNWGNYSSNARTKLCFGKIESLKNMEKGIVLTLNFNGDKTQAMLLPYTDGARLWVYKPYINMQEKRFNQIELSDIEDGGYKINKDYVFAKLYDDVVTDVMIIDYYR